MNNCHVINIQESYYFISLWLESVSAPLGNFIYILVG